MCNIISTLGMERETWLKLRKKGVGGSDAGAVCGLNPYSSPMNVYYDKISESVSDYDNEAMRQGRDLEDYVAQRFMEETGYKVHRSNKMYWSEEYPFMFADVDRLVVGKDAGLECKTVSPYNADKWKDGTVPMHYIIQCFHYMIVTGKKSWYLAAVILGQRFVYSKIEWDEEFAQSLIALESDFWNYHVLTRQMPEPDGSQSCNAILETYFHQAKKAEAIKLSEELEKRLDYRKKLVDEIQRLEKEKVQIEQEVKVFMDGHREANSEHYHVTWQEVVSSRLDSKRLKTEQPNIYKEFLQESRSSRFTVKSAR